MEKTYLVIGASGGVGSSVAEELLSQGHKVIGTYNSNSIEPKGKLEAHHLDVMNIESLDFIPEQLDGLVYCPGSIQLKPFNRFKTEDFLQDYQLQVVGFTEVLKNSINALKASNNGSIVTYSTVAVQSGFPFHAQVSASKGAIEGLTRALSAELAPSVRINSIAPSITNTPLAGKLLNSEQKMEANAERHPLKRVGTPKDIAKLTSYLLSEDSSWMTGQVIQLDGGISTIKN
ncbi:SDR family NAD(P)-dependent oxidoreductase [Jiulongibacter sp. NS-SX5]|uniref:SDR family NAD(P)-dependent oxidoreductase n=1 Tax=Jiulongibacter sp. NS-SX5 TaxID=3463854 RepID=UPI004057F4FE